MSALSVHLNREKPRDIDAPATFTATEPFDIALENHGNSSHVHVQLDDRLFSVASLAQREQRVAEGTTKQIHVSVEPLDEPITGELFISLGYGAARAKTTVTIEQTQQEKSEIAIDESLGTPQQPTERRGPSVRVLALLALAGAALLSAVAVALTVESPVVLGAAVTVALVAVVGVVVALY